MYKIFMAASMAAVLTFSMSVNAAETKREQFGDWGFICSKPDQGENPKESCNLFQTAVLNQTVEEGAEPQAQRVLLTRIGYLEGNENPVLLITTPLGVLLPMGVVVEVEGHDPIRIPMQRCDGGGCLAYVIMEQPFIDACKKGTEAKVTFYDPQQRGISIPLSLKGFTKGLSELSKSRN